MFVCHGNICRSPMAEFIMKDLVSRAGRSEQFYIASSATSSEEIRNDGGNPVYPAAKAELAKHGLLAEGKRAVQLTRADYEKYDLFVGMDRYNIQNMNRIFGEDPDAKISKLLEHTGRRDDVADPWYSNRFDLAYRDIYEGCQALLQKLLKESEEGNTH